MARKMKMEMTLGEMEQHCEAQMGRPVTSIAAHTMILGYAIAQMYYYTVEYDKIGIEYRFELFVHGKATAGGSVPRSSIKD